MLSNNPSTCHGDSTQIANLYTFGLTYTTNNHHIYIRYVTDAWTPILYMYQLIVILFYFSKNKRQ
jgi:hypothetical protein